MARQLTPLTIYQLVKGQNLNIFLRNFIEGFKANCVITFKSAIERKLCLCLPLSITFLLFGIKGLQLSERITTLLSTLIFFIVAQLPRTSTQCQINPDNTPPPKKNAKISDFFVWHLNKVRLGGYFVKKVTINYSQLQHREMPTPTHFCVIGAYQSNEKLKFEKNIKTLLNDKPHYDLKINSFMFLFTSST